LARTYLDELIDYPARVAQKIGNSKECIALLVNKNINLVTEDDVDDAFDRFIYDYSYVDDTITESAAFICVEAEVPYVQNRQIKNMRIYVTVACHKRFMEIDTDIIGGTAGNRRDNLIRYIDKELNDSDIFGIGRLSLKSVKTLSSTNQDFSVRELCYDVPDFNLRRDLDENRIRWFT